MSTDQPKVTQAPERPKHGPQTRGHGPMAVGPTEKAITFLPSLKRLLRMLRPERALIAAVVGLTVVAQLANVVGPVIIGAATNIVWDGVTSGAGVDLGRLRDVLAVALVLAVVTGGFMWAQGWLLTGITQRTVYRMREQVAAKLDRLPIGYFDRQPRGELLSRVTNDIDNVAQSLQQTLSQVLSSLLTLVGVLVMMFWVSPLLALVVIAGIPLSMGAAMMIGKRSQSKFAGMWAATGAVNAVVEEAYSGHSLVKVFGRQREVAAAFSTENAKLHDAAFGAQFLSGLMMPVMFFIGNLTYVAVAVVGGLRVASGAMTLGDVQAFIQYSRMFTQPVTQLASMANLMQSGVASAERVFQVLDADEEARAASGSMPVPVRGEVSFENVTFSYDPKRPLITDLSFHARPGSTVAIVGPTGAGKTTLVNLLLRFYELGGGRITIDGVDIASVPRAELREQIGMVLQDTWLFHGTIRDTIAYGRPGASEAEIMAAATATYVDRFVHSLPEGYDTVIDEEGSNISVGEKQLITIARAFLSNPSLLILDEATSSVDTRTEVLVQRAMKALRADRTSFVIAHRLSTIRDADVILVMDAGAIVEVGAHHELLAARGPYHDLYQSQFQAALLDEADTAA